MSPIEEKLSEQFYEWELRGRGWQVFDEPIHPEPPFRPFHGHFLPDEEVVDDGLRPTFLSSLVQSLSRKLSTAPREPVETLESDEEPEPDLLIRDPLIEIKCLLPQKLNIPRESFEQFFLSLSLCHEPIAFEIIGVNKQVAVQFAACPNDAPLVLRQLEAYFPEALFQTRESALDTMFNGCEEEETFVVEFGLDREFMHPLASGKLDAFVGIIGALSKLNVGEFGLFQVLWQPVKHSWPESIINSVSHADGKPFFVNDPELTSAAENKVNRPLFAAVVRIMVKAGDFDRVLQLSRDLAASLRVFSKPGGNELIPLSNEEYPFAEHLDDALRRQTRRSGMILNSDELIGFVHLPSEAVRSSVLERAAERTKAAPAIVRNATGLFLGNNVYNGESIPVRLATEERVRHTYVIGATGTGKSTLLFNLIREDIENGQGVGVLDPSGDLIDRILGVIPQSRINDVVLIDPSDTDFPVGFNMLSAHSDIEKSLLASDLVSMFRRLSTSWGDQMDMVLRNAILAFLESSTGGTLSDLRRFLIEPSFRTQFLATVREPEVVYYWQKVFPHLTGSKSVGPVLTRLQTFLSEKPIRLMVSQRENRLDFGKIMDTGQIFLAKLSEGLMGVNDARLLGTVLVSKFQQLAMARQVQQMSLRRDFWLYIDEFDHFITPSMAGILASTRKYRLGLTLAHHELHQLQQNPDVASAVMSHPATRIVFKMSDDDAKKMAEGFFFFEARDLQNLPKGHAICRVGGSAFDFNLVIPLPEQADEVAAAKRRTEVITASREKYGTPRAQVDTVLGQGLESEQQSFKSTKTEAICEQTSLPKPPVASTSPPSEPKTIEEAQRPVTALELTQTDGVAATTQHEAIKKQITTEAEILDYTVTPEEFVPGSKKKVDLVLRRGHQKIACEISVTNTIEYEAAINITKCVNAEFGQIACVCKDRRKLSKIQQRFAEMNPADHSGTVNFYTPDEFISKLFDWATEDPEGGAIEREKPRKRKLHSEPLTESQRKAQAEQMLKELRQAMKR